MLIYSSKPEVESKVVIKHIGIRAWKTTVSVFHKTPHYFAILDIGKHYWSEAHPTWCKFHQEGFLICLMKTARWGMDHVYYDGNHCLFSLGYLHFEWHNPKCKKCDPDGLRGD